MLKELGSVAGRKRNQRYREKKGDSQTLQCKVEGKGGRQWKDVVSCEQINQRCLTEWRDSNVPERIKRESFVTHMLNKFCMHGDLVKEWYRSSSRPPLPLAEDPQVTTSQAALVVPALAAALTTGGSEGAAFATLLEGLVEVKAELVEAVNTVKAELTHTVNMLVATMDNNNEKMFETMKTMERTRLELEAKNKRKRERERQHNALAKETVTVKAEAAEH
jgi:hypothetical protein